MYLPTEQHSLSTFLYFLLFKKLAKTFSKSPEILFCLSFKISLSRLALSKALDKSRKTLLTSKTSNILLVFWIIDTSWLISTGLNSENSIIFQILEVRKLGGSFEKKLVTFITNITNSDNIVFSDSYRNLLLHPKAHLIYC